MQQFEKQLLAKVMAEINRQQKRAICWRLVMSIMALSVSSGLMCLAIFWFREQARVSAFWQFTKLIFSDFRSVAQYWQNFTVSILEALPIESLLILLLATLSLFYAFKFFWKNYKSIGQFQQLKLIH